MARVRRWSRANRDLTSIVRHIARDNPAAAHRWLTSIEELFCRLAAQPEMSAVCETRRFGLIRRHSFGNYVIYYRPIDDGIDVLRVLHGARDQGPLL